MRRVLPVLLLLALLLQQLVLPLLPGRIEQQAHMLAHAWVHAEGVAHHHHHDGDMHADPDSRDAPPAAHVHADAGGPSQMAVLMPAIELPDLSGVNLQPGYAPPFHPDLNPEGLLRPPRHLVG